MIISCWEGSFWLTISAALIHFFGSHWEEVHHCGNTKKSKNSQLRTIRKKRQKQRKSRRRVRNGATLSFTSHLNLKAFHRKSSLKVLSFHNSARLGTQYFTYMFWGHSRSRVLPSFAETKRGVYKNSFKNWEKTRSLVTVSFWCSLDWRINSVDLVCILFHGQRGRHPYQWGLIFLVWIYYSYEYNLWVLLLYPQHTEYNLYAKEAYLWVVYSSFLQLYLGVAKMERWVHSSCHYTFSFHKAASQS